MSIVGTKIKEARLSKRIRQSDLAELLEVSESTIRTWEQGVSEPFPFRIPKLEEILGIKLTEDEPSSQLTAADIELAYWMDKQLEETGFLPMLGQPVPQTAQEEKPW